MNINNVDYIDAYNSSDDTMPFHTNSLALPLDSVYFARNISSCMAIMPNQ